MDFCLSLGRLEEESAMKLMLEEESRERRKEVQRLKKEDWIQRYWKKETKAINAKMTKLELEDNIGVRILEEILTKVLETAENALEMEVDNFDCCEVCMDVTEEVNNWVDVRYGIQNNADDVQTEIILDLEGLDLETGNGLRVGYEIETKDDKEECIISVHCTGNCADDIENETVIECGLRVGISPEKVDRNGLEVGIITEE